ncbi:MAG: 2-C-methyl-D-erythritol 4-phosphate cytidylyltransferase [Firmicutes bacterium]|nr:2-C-methyl-D-erythritol 4-phosphate cytidylyltransferase [Bacillota bacterium]
MIFGAILAGGIGTRMGNVEKPKQYLVVGGKPIIIHTVETFTACEKLDKVIVLCPEDWIDYTQALFEEYGVTSEQAAVISGGAMRNDTIMNAISYIDEQYGLEDDTILLTHDAVRPLVTKRIIEDNIIAVREKGACDTVVPATDTIVESLDGDRISHVPDRAHLYQGQTPQSFKAKEFRDLYLGLTDHEKEILTDAAKVFVIKGRNVALVKGETYNVKITYPSDLQLAESLLGENV